ncbi:MAG: DUF4870 domain-containing protein [Chloroflexota bacterium]
MSIQHGPRAQNASLAPVAPPAQAGRLRTQIRQKATEHVDQRIAAVCHLSIGFGVVVGVGFLVGLAINLVIWLRSKRSSVVEFHSEQAGAYQLAVLITNIAIVGIWIGVLVWLMGYSQIGTGNLSVGDMLAGLWALLLPVQLAWYIGTIAYGLYAGVKVAAGRDFSYPIFGKWARGRVSQGK